MLGWGGRDSRAPGAFVATNTKSFARLMGEAMSLMDYRMTNAAMNGNPDHDFAAMMIPHHEGAIDMAKGELLYRRNSVLRRLAQEIIVTQGSEIAVMQLLALAGNAGGSGALDPVAKFMTNPAGAAIVAAVGPPRDAVEGSAGSSRRYLVIAPINDGRVGAAVQVQR